MLRKKHIHKLKKARSNLAFLVCITLLSACPHSQPSNKSKNLPKETNNAYVIKIKDGDSLILRGTNNKEFEARLFGIDAPELNQPYGKEAKQALSKFAYKQYFSIDIKDTDKYQRAVVILTQKSRVLNRQMVETGNAWVYRQYNPDSGYISLENSAKKSQKGLWQLPRPIAPWNWRKQQSSKR